ncbi:MAG: serine/threonine protein kinase [Defluviitaleaceae bacterium]|nr:serine/threonine protein kinase [Defluviitaleaceae bacterium]
MTLENIPVLEKYKVKAEIAVHEDKSIYHVEDAEGVPYILKIFGKTYKHPLYKNLSKLAHENMPLIHDVALLDDCFYVIEECIAGRTLREILDENGALGKKETLGILMQLCDVLVYLHGQPAPIIHRDITTTNIMVTDDGTVKLIDFDIAREHKETATTDTEVIGTKYFAPPEQYGFSQSDPRTDIYALGMLMTVMLTNTYEVQRVKDAQIATVIERCMMLSPDKRFQTVKKLADRLERISNNKLEPHVKAIVASVILIFSAIVLFIVVSGRINEEARNMAADARLEYIFLTPVMGTFAEDFQFSLRPVFDSDIFEYTVNLPYDFDDIYMHFTPYNLASSASVFINQFEMWSFDDFSAANHVVFIADETTDRLNVHAIPSGGGVVISVVVTSEDGSASETYVIRFNRQAADSVRLRYITFSEIRDNPAEEFNVVLNPEFDPAIFDYTVYVPDYPVTFWMNFGPYDRGLPARIYRNNEYFWSVSDFRLLVSIVFTTNSNFDDTPYIPPEFLYLGYIPVGEEVAMSIVVMSEDGTRSETYVVRYIRQGAE